MTYYPDLSPCSYFDERNADKLVAVGWLEENHSYTLGELSESFVDKLIDLLVKPWAPMYFMGFHDCPFCTPPEGPYKLVYKGTTIQVGSYNLFVPSDGFLYVAPSLIAHYILSHGYAPPAEFYEAVMRCPPMRSREYLDAIKTNGPKEFADRIKS